MKIKCGGLSFFSTFDSGNLARVELVHSGHDVSRLSCLYLPSLPQNSQFLSTGLEERGYFLRSRSQDFVKRSPFKVNPDEIEQEPFPDLYCTTEFYDLGDPVEQNDLGRESYRTDIREDTSPAEQLEFNVWTRADCEGTPFENGNRTWFYFGIEGGIPKQPIKINVMNLNQQTKLMSQGMAPVYRVLPGRQKWERIISKPTYKMEGINCILTFDHELPAEQECQTFFAFTYPFSYTACQKMLGQLDQLLPNGLYANKCEKDEELYYSRELLCHTLCGRRVDLLTVTSYKSMLPDREAKLQNLFPNDSEPRSHRFSDKKVVFISSRVHPGETQSSLIFNGFLRFLLSKTDQRACMLRDLFVFKMIPMLNPDGVAMGNYRTSSRGVNLNRVYLVATAETYPTVFASRSLMMYYHYEYSAVRISRNLDPLSIYDLLTVGANHEEKLFSIRKHPFERPVLRPRHKTYTKLQEGGVQGISFTDASKKKQTRRCEAGTPLLSKQMVPLSPDESGLALFVDLHGHASKKGCFFFGNYFQEPELKAESLLLSKIMSLNCPHFDMESCNFTHQNMYTKSSKDGLSKEGCARVTIYLQTGIVHSYTLECNFNTSRMLNDLPPLDDERRKRAAALGMWSRKIPKYTPEIFAEIGKALAISILDMTGQNPVSRLRNSMYQDVEGVRQWLRSYVRDKRKVHGLWQSSRHNSWTGGLNVEANSEGKSELGFSNRLEIPRNAISAFRRPSSNLSNRESAAGSDSEVASSEGCCPADATRYKSCRLKAASTVAGAVARQKLQSFGGRKQVVAVRLPLPTIVPPRQEVWEKNAVAVGKVSTAVRRLRQKRQQQEDSNCAVTGSVQLLVRGEILRQRQRLPRVETVLAEKQSAIRKGSPKDAKKRSCQK